MPTYPSTLAQPNNSGYSLDAKKNKEEFISEFGTRRQRKFVTSQVYVVQLRFDFKKKSEYDEFLKFLKYDIDYGSLWFVADWLLEEGFSEGEWVWKFVKINYNASGYSMGFSCTCLMGPRYSNIISDDYVELGIEGSFFDSATDFECEELTYLRTFRYRSQRVEVVDFNESNWTVIGNYLDLSTPTAMTNTRTICAMKENRIALANNTSVCTLRMFEFDGENFTQLGSGTNLATYSTIRTKICRLSNSKVALFDGGLQTLTCWEFDFALQTWSLVGSSFNMSSYMSGASNGCITTLIENSRIAFISDSSSKLAVFDFNGSTWSLVGSASTLYSTGGGSAFFTISAMSATEIVLTHDAHSGTGTHAYEKRLTKFTFNGSSWSAGTPSSQFSNGGVPRVATMAIDKIAIARSDGTDMGAVEAEFVNGSFSDVGNFLKIGSGADSTIQLASYFIPA